MRAAKSVCVKWSHDAFYPPSRYAPDRPTDAHVVPDGEQHAPRIGCDCAPMLLEGETYNRHGQRVRVFAHRRLN